MTEIQFFVPPILSFNSSSSVQVIINPTCESLDQIELLVRQRYYENLKHSISKRETLRNSRRYLIYDKPPEKKQKKKKRKCPSGRCFNNYDLQFPKFKLIYLKGHQLANLPYSYGLQIWGRPCAFKCNLSAINVCST